MSCTWALSKCSIQTISTWFFIHPQLKMHWRGEISLKINTVFSQRCGNNIFHKDRLPLSWQLCAHTNTHTHNSYLMVTEGAAAAAPPPCKKYSSRMSAQQQLHKTVHSSPQTHYASALRLSYCYNGQPSNSSTNTAARRLVTVCVLSRVKSTVWQQALRTVTKLWVWGAAGRRHCDSRPSTPCCSFPGPWTG